MIPSPNTNCVLICTVADSFTPTLSGTTGIITWEYCQAARRAGHEPLVIARRQTAEPYPWANTILLDWPWVPKGKVGDFVMRAQRKLTGWQHFREGAFAAKVVKAIKQAGVGHLPMILQNDVEPAIYLRDHFPDATIIHHFQNQQLCREQFRKRFAGARIIATAVSNYTAQWIEEYYGLPKNSAKTVYNGVDSERFYPAHGNGANELDGSRKPVVSFIGRTGIEKAPDLVLRASLKVAEKTQNFSVQILGANQTGYVNRTDYQKELESLAAQLESLGISVRMPGFLVRKDVPDEIRKGHIHVTPSRWEEPFGIVTLEAMSSGLATVASRTGGTPEFVGDAGLLFAKDAVEELAGHLEKLILNEPLRREMGERGREQAKRFPWDRAWTDFVSLFPKNGNAA